jgi:hypothetical protein
MANFKWQMAKGKCETTNHLPFDLCRLPFAFLAQPELVATVSAFSDRGPSIAGRPHGQSQTD